MPLLNLTQNILRRKNSSVFRTEAKDFTTIFFKKRIKWMLIILILVAVLGATVVFSVMVGTTGPIGPGEPERMPFNAVVDILTGHADRWDTNYRTIVLDIRLPRVLLAALVGCALALCGAVMQGIFRNPMADPYIIGVSAGAALGASIAFLALPLTLTQSGIEINVAVPLFAFFGALGAVLLVYTIARVGPKVPVDNLLLAGIAVSTFLSAITAFLIVQTREPHGIIFWLMGGLWANSNWLVISLVLPVVAGCTFSLLLFARALNLLQLGEEPARLLGLDIERTKKLLLILSVTLTAIAVAFTGLIGFVGLVIPHIMRLLVGPDHRILLPTAALTGAFFLIWADTAARSVSEMEFPVGIVTALCGAPFFIYLLLRRKHQ